VAQTKQNQLTLTHPFVQDYANSERIGASAETSSNITAAVNSANQLYHDGIRSLGDSVESAKELLEDRSS
jgi:hypothetical protein